MATALQQIARLDLLADRVARTPAFGALATLQRELLPDHEGAVADLVDAAVDDDGYVDVVRPYAPGPLHQFSGVHGHLVLFYQRLAGK